MPIFVDLYRLGVAPLGSDNGSAHLLRDGLISLDDWASDPN